MNQFRTNVNPIVLLSWNPHAGFVSYDVLYQIGNDISQLQRAQCTVTPGICNCGVDPHSSKTLMKFFMAFYFFFQMCNPGVDDNEKRVWGCVSALMSALEWALLRALSP